MAYTLVGNDPIDRASLESNNTYIDLNNPAQGRGIIKEVRVYAGGVSTIKIKFFRDNGTQYVFLGETASLTLAIGLNIYQVWFPVEKGDLIAFRTPDTNTVDFTASGSVVWKAGDVTTTELKSAWTAAAQTPSVQGKIHTRMAPL